VEEWRPDPGGQVARTIAIRRAERDARYQQAVLLREQGHSMKEITCQLGASERTVRLWFRRGVAPDTRPRRKRQSDFDPYAAYVLKRWRDGERNGTRLWQEIAAQGYPGSQRMVYRFLSTLKTTEVNTAVGTQGVLHYTSRAAVCLFRQHPDTPLRGRTSGSLGSAPGSSSALDGV
jgi:transposase